MTLEEAKKILEKEFAVISLHKSTEPFEFDESGWIEHEKPSVLEAFRVLSKGGYYISISGHDYNMREKRLKKEYEENTKAPGSAENHIKEDSVVNTALKEAASQFNDALLDEQGKKINRLGKEISRLNGIIHDKNEEIKRKTKGCCELVAEKDEVIADLGNELAATKKELEEKTKLVETVRRGSKEYCEYGISAEKMIRKMANVIVYEGKVSSKEFEEYRRWANGYRFNPKLYDFIEEEEKKLEHAKKIRVSSDNAEEGADLYGVIVLCDKDYIDALKKAKDADIWQE